MISIYWLSADGLRALYGPVTDFVEIRRVERERIRYINGVKIIDHIPDKAPEPIEAPNLGDPWDSR